MRPASTEWQRQRNADNFDDLDSIVAEVFQSLEESESRAKGAADERHMRQRDGSTQSEVRSLSKRGEDATPATAAETQPRHDDPLMADRASPLPSEAAMDAAPLQVLSSNAGAGSISAEEQAFVEGALAFLLERPNAELLLENLRGRFLEGGHVSAGLGRTPAAPERADGASASSKCRKDA
jgi:hypothetical protein